MRLQPLRRALMALLTALAVVVVAAPALEKMRRGLVDLISISGASVGRATLLTRQLGSSESDLPRASDAKLAMSIVARGGIDADNDTTRDTFTSKKQGSRPLPTETSANGNDKGTQAAAPSVQTSQTLSNSTSTSQSSQPDDGSLHRPTSPIAGFTSRPTYIALTQDDLTKCQGNFQECIPGYREKWKAACIKHLDSVSETFRKRKTYGWYMFKLDPFRADHISEQIMTVVAACYEVSEYDRSGMHPGRPVQDVTTSVQRTLHWDKSSASGGNLASAPGQTDDGTSSGGQRTTNNDEYGR